jgi:hypothetical protein
MKIKAKGTLIDTDDILTIGEVTENNFGGSNYYTFIIKFKNQSELKVVIQGSDYPDYKINKKKSNEDMKERITKIYDFVCKYWVGEDVNIPEIN